MVRPRRIRRIAFQPSVTYFKPRGIPLTSLEEEILSYDETEAVRLVDLEGIEQEKAAKQMRISQPTFSRLVEVARKKIADTLIRGKAIRIEGGNFKMVELPKRRFKCFGCGYEFEKDYGTGRPEKCPKCSSRNIHRHTLQRGPQRGRGMRFGRV